MYTGGRTTAVLIDNGESDELEVYRDDFRSTPAHTEVFGTRRWVGWTCFGLVDGKRAESIKAAEELEAHQPLERVDSCGDALPTLAAFTKAVASTAITFGKSPQYICQ